MVLKPEMRKSTTDRMNDYDAVVMGVLEPILVLSVMAVMLFWCGYPGKGLEHGLVPTSLLPVITGLRGRHSMKR